MLDSLFLPIEYAWSHLFPFPHLLLPFLSSSPSVCHLFQQTLSVGVKQQLNFRYGVSEIGFREFTLPNNNHPPSLWLQKSILPKITFPVRLNFRHPKFRIGFRQYELRAVLEPVPETSVHKWYNRYARVKDGIFNCFSIYYNKNYGLIIQFNV